MTRPVASAYPQLQNASGVLQAVIDKSYDAHIQDALLTDQDGQEVLDFNLPLNYSKMSLVENESLVAFGGSVFRLRTIGAGFDASDNWAYTVHCEALWYDLGASDPVPIITNETSPTNVLTTALAGTGWTVGTVQPAAGPSFTSTGGMSALAIIRAMPGVFGGEIQFDSVNRKVHLWNTRGSVTQLLYARGKNAASDQITIDTTNLFTRVYPYGSNGVSIASLNSGVPYLEDYSWYDAAGQPRQMRAIPVTNDALTTPAAVLAWGQGQLSLYSQPAISYTFQLSLLKTDTVPKLGDTVKVWDKVMNLQGNARVVSRDYYPLEPARDVITINTSQYNLANQLANQGGGAGAGTGTVNADTLAPSTPTNVVVVINPSFDQQGNRQLMAGITWNAVTTNIDASTLVDFDHYEVQYQTDGGAWTPLGNTTDTSVDTPALVVQNSVEARIRAVDHAGNPSAWGLSSNQSVSVDSTPPNKPSTPTYNANTLPLAIEIMWDGKDSTGAAMPADFNYLEVHLGTTPGFAISAATLIDIQTGTLGGTTVAPNLQPSTTYYFKFRAADNAGNKSALSNEASATVGALPDNYIASMSVSKLTAATATLGTLHADVTVASRIKTADVGNRTEMNTAGFQAFNAAGYKTFQVSDVDGSVAAWMPSGFQSFLIDGNGNVHVTGNIQAGTTFPNSVYGYNAVHNHSADDVDPNGLLLEWSYVTAGTSGVTVGIGAYASGGTGWTVYRETASPISGKYSLSMKQTSNTDGASAESNAVNVVPGERWDLRCDFKQTFSTQARPVFFGALFYDSNGVLLTTSITPDQTTQNVVLKMDGSIAASQLLSSSFKGRLDIVSNWTPLVSGTVYRGAGTIIVPAGAVTMRLWISAWTAAAANSTTTTTVFDNFYAVRARDGLSSSQGVITGGTVRTSAIAAGNAYISMQPNNAWDTAATVNGFPLPILVFMPTFGYASQATHPRISGIESVPIASGATNNNAIRLAGGAYQLAGSIVNNGPPYNEQTITVYPRSYSEEKMATGYVHHAGIMMNIMGGDSTGVDDNVDISFFINPASIGATIPIAEMGSVINNIAAQLASGEIRVTGYYGTYSTVAASSFPVRSSSKFTKQDIKELDFNPLQAVIDAPVYQWRHDARFVSGSGLARTRVGPMVEDLHPVLHHEGHAVSRYEHPHAQKGYDLADMVGVLWGAVQELHSRVHELQSGAST